MALVDQAHGTQTATIGTEHTLSTGLTGKTFVLAVDTVNMVSGDTLELRLYTRVLTGGTTRVAFYDAWNGAQSVDDLLKISVPCPCTYDSKFTLKQTTGTGRAFDWAVLSVD